MDENDPNMKFATRFVAICWAVAAAALLIFGVVKIIQDWN